jgi:hypothetical protein
LIINDALALVCLYGKAAPEWIAAYFPSLRHEVIDGVMFNNGVKQLNRNQSLGERAWGNEYRLSCMQMNMLYLSGVDDSSSHHHVVDYASQ